MAVVNPLIILHRIFSSSSPWLPRLLPTLSLISLLTLFLILKHQKTRNRHRLPPGPPKLPFIGNLPPSSLRQLSLKHGPVMLLRLGGVQTLVVSSPESAKQVLKTNDLDCCSRPSSRGATRLTYNYLDVVLGPYTEYWKQIRRIYISEIFSPKRVRSYSNIRVQEVSHLIESLSKLSSSSPGNTSNNSVNLSEKVFDLTKIFVCRISFGKNFIGKQFENRNFEKVIGEAMILLGSFWAADFFPYVGFLIDEFTGLNRRLEKCFTEFDAFFEGIIDEHLDPNRTTPETEDITDTLLRLSGDETAPVRLSRDHIKSILLDIFLGSTDTSAVAIVWAMAELIKNPRVMKKVQAEIRGHTGRKPRVELQDIENFSYLKMVVKETLRLHPPAALLIPHESIKHCNIGGYDVYPKTRILVNAWALGRDPGSWENPEEFCPERFEDNNIDLRGQDFELVPFGAGRRICPGITMGCGGVEFTLANLLHCFDWEMPPGMTRKDVDMEEEAGLIVHKKSPLYLVPLKYECQATL